MAVVKPTDSLAAVSRRPRKSLGDFNAMKQFTPCFILSLAIALLGCQSTPEPPGPSAWRQLFATAQPLTRQQVYAIAGKPVRETESAAYWESLPVKKGWLRPETYVRELKVDFDANGDAVRMYDGTVRKK